MIDVTEQVNAVSRTVGSRTLAAGQAKVVTMSRVYRTGLDDLWDACTSIERIPRWFLPITGELKVGGHYQLQGNAGGTVERCDPPTGFDATWEYGDEVSWIEVRLSAEGEGSTRFTLEHIAHVDDERWAEYGPGAAGVGWDMALLGLGQYLEPGKDGGITPEQGEAWAASEEGKQYLGLASERWGAASIAAGTEEAAARAAAERTTAFYTGG